MIQIKKLSLYLRLFFYLFLFISLSHVQMACDSTSAPVSSFSVGGTLSGLSGTLVLELNGGSDLALTADGDFVFSGTLENNASYLVSILSQPEGQTCSITNGTGTVQSANVTNVQITCAAGAGHTIGGTISGLVGTVILQNNGSDDLSLVSDGLFIFSQPVAADASYNVTVLTQPTGYTCEVANGSGDNVNADVTDVQVTCAINEYNVGGTVSGLSGQVVIQNNGSGTIALASDGPYYYTLSYGSPYSIAIADYPNDQTCEITGCSEGTLSNGVCSGTATGDITDINVTCTHFNLYAYVSSDSNNTIYSCGINSHDGSF